MLVAGLLVFSSCFDWYAVLCVVYIKYIFCNHVTSINIPHHRHAFPRVPHWHYSLVGSVGYPAVNEYLGYSLCARLTEIVFASFSQVL